jgi:hypothetical protein
MVKEYLQQDGDLRMILEDFYRHFSSALTYFDRRKHLCNLLDGFNAIRILLPKSSKSASRVTSILHIWNLKGTLSKPAISATNGRVIVIVGGDDRPAILAGTTRRPLYLECQHN